MPGFPGWGFGERGDERQRRPVVSPARVPGPQPGVAGPCPLPPAAPAVLAARGRQGARGVHKDCIPSPLHPCIPPSPHPSVLRCLHPFNPSPFHPSLPLGWGRFHRPTKGKVEFLIKNKIFKKSAKWSKFPIYPPTLSPRGPRGRSNAAQPGGNNIQQPCKEQQSLFKPVINPTYLAAIWT